jgi:type VI secretion system secreted protein VgrG
MADINPTQDGRVGKLATPLGKDKLCLTRFEGVEAMGELFEFRIEAVSTDPNIDFNPALGRNCSVHLDTTDQTGRDFSGILTEARWVGTRLDLQLYQLVLRPWIWMLSLASNCQIYENQSPKDIIKDALGNGKYGDTVDLMTGDYPTLEYTVQYRETYLNFVLRLMEKYGIYYYFKFEQGDGDSPSTHYLVLADSTTHEPLSAPSSVSYLRSTAGARRDIQQFNYWSKIQGMASGISVLNDYDYTKPNTDMFSQSTHLYEFNHGHELVYDYPGGYDDRGEGDKLAAVRVDSERTRAERCSARGYAPSLTPGFTIQRTSPDGDSQDDTYLVLRCTHWFGDQAYESVTSGTSDSGAAYSGTYELSKSSLPYRMPLRTRRPVIIGSQPAKVTSKDNQEIDVDKLGRVLVEFYWELKYYGDKDKKRTPSRRVRVGQFWAGSIRGALFIPRVGDEVMVAYEDGDPDRPIIVGSVYNGVNTVPTPLPGNKTHSGILTRSSPASKTNKYNMLLFEDDAGHEFVKLRSQRNLMFKALADEQRDIGGSQTENIGGDETINVGGPTGGGNWTVNAAKTITLNVGPGGAGTQIKMDMSSITLSVGPGGAAAQIKMDASGVTITGTLASMLKVAPQSITTMTPLVSIGIGPVTFLSPMVTIPTVTIGAGTASGLPII